MSLQSSAGVPPPPLTGGSMNLRSLQVSKNTKTFGKMAVPVMTGAAAVIATSAGDGSGPSAGDMVFITTVNVPLATTNTFSTPNKLYVNNGTTANFGWELVSSA
jgi:hypothetical protein